MNRYMIIIPAFNEAESIKGTIDKLRKAISKQFSIVVVNDGSRDSTEQIVKKLGVRCVSLPFNMGIGNAVHTGYMLALKDNFDGAIQFDADGQHPEKSLQDLIQPLEDTRPMLSSVPGLSKKEVTNLPFLD